VQQSLSEPSLKTCPECSGELIKVFGQVGVTFKGSGFYQNDFGSNSKTKKSE
jgi:predicted nucleic acid-binding Zn ribbon protein